MAQLAKHALFGAAVAAATGVPLALHTATSGKPSTESAPDVRRAADSTLLSSLPGSESKPLEGLPVADVAELFSFEITPAWVHDRWPRVLASWAGPNLQTYRVPVMTGTRPEDLAGSLSYVFDTSQQLQKIEFTGVTGNARPLVTHLTGKHGFIPVATNNPGVQQYQVQSGGYAMSQLTVRKGALVESHRPHGSQQLELVMRRPAGRTLFTEAKKAPLDTIRWP